MSLRLSAVSAVFAGLLFVLGLPVLFILNPQAYAELNNLSLASYNIPGMNGQLWVATIVYSGTGLFNIIFCIGLLRDAPHSHASLIGKILLTLCALTWLSFGLLPYNPTANISSHLLLIRLIIFILASFTSLLLLSVEYSRIAQDRFLKYYTLLSAGLILLLSLLSIFVYNDETWIRTNISLTLYFLWLAVFGLFVLLK